MPAALVALLREWRDEWRDGNGREPGPDDLVFPEMAGRGRAVSEAQAWEDYHSVTGEIGPVFGFSAIRATGAVREFTTDVGALRSIAERLGHSPPEFFGHDEPSFARRYLPLYGESASDGHRRAAGDMPGFGRWAFGKHGYAWFLNRRQAASARFRLFWFLDGVRDAYDMTLNEALMAFDPFERRRAEEALDRHRVLLDERLRDTWLADLEEALDDLRSELEKIRAAWISHLYGEEPTPHRCGLTPIDAPDEQGVYFLRSRSPSDHAIACKIGWGKSIRKRIEGLQTAHPWPLELLAFVPGASLADEKALHRCFEHLRLREAPGTEWFELRDELVAEILARRGAS